MCLALTGPVLGLYGKAEKNARVTRDKFERLRQLLPLLMRGNTVEISITKGGRKRKGGKTMSEKEERIMNTMAKAVNSSPERNKDYLLGWVVGAASVVCGPQQTAEKNSA